MILRHDRTDRDCVVKEAHWPGLTTFFRGRGAAALIAPTWLITAAHVVEGIPSGGRLSVEIAGNRYRVMRAIQHPAFDPTWIPASEDSDRQTVDLALVELDAPVAGIDPYPLYEGADEQGREALLLGWGQFGDGLRGARGFDRGLRQATNLIDEADSYWLSMRFDAPPGGTRLEGVCGDGDSGGPAFIQRDGQYLLAGVSSWQRTSGRPLGLYGCVEHYARVSPYLTWIHATTTT